MAELQNLAPELKTAPIPAERKKSQYALLKALVPLGGDQLVLPGDAFLFRCKTKESSYICVQSEGLSLSSRANLLRCAQSAGLLEAELTEGMFLFLAYNLKGTYKPKSEYMTRESAENLINIVDDSYVGHSIYDVMKWFRDIVVYEVPPDSPYSTRNNYAFAALFVSSVQEFKSARINDITAGKIARLLEFQNLNPENLYLALTSNHWNHIVLELYKCLEPAYYLPWVRALRARLSFTMPGLTLARHCRLELNWQEKEEESIVRIFELLPEESVRDGAVARLKCFSGLEPDRSKAGAIGRRLYKIRNQLVHQQDHSKRSATEIRSHEWPILCEYLCDIIYLLYSNYSTDMAFEYLP